MKAKLEDVQALELKMLDHTIDILDSLGIRWCAAYGTLLGAIREGGMIPWDDDIDIWVSRKDFNRLCEIGNKLFQDPYFFQTPETDTICNTIIHIRYNGTASIGKYAQDVTFHKGVFIDIFPVDHIFKDEKKNQKLFDAIDLIFNDLKYDKTDLVRKEVNTTHANAHVFRFLNELLYVIDDQNKDSGIVSFTTMWRNKEESSHARISDKCFSSFREVDFKGLKHKINIPCGYDEILTTMYGDYMIPKKGVGVAHSVEFFDLDRDYKYYENMRKEEFDKLFENL